MEVDELYSIVRPDENLSLEDIYLRSKKDDDFEIDSSDYTYLYLLTTVGLPSEIEDRIIDIKRNRVTLCRRIWRGIRVSFLLDPSSSQFATYLNTLRRLIDLGVREFNEEFVKSKDLEILNYPDPSPHQIGKLQKIQERIAFASSKS